MPLEWLWKTISGYGKILTGSYHYPYLYSSSHLLGQLKILFTMLRHQLEKYSPGMDLLSL